MNIKEIIKHFKTQAQSRFNPSPDGSREAYYNGRKDAYNDCADILERYAVKYPNGWHPASELPKLKDGEDEVECYCLVHGIGLTILVPMKLHYTASRGFGVSKNIEIKWWCYPPNED